MEIVTEIFSLRAKLQAKRKQGLTISFVPTMGALHEGHLSLIHAAKKESEIVVVSIFVNPKQFGPNEDFVNYPRQLDKDLALLALEGVDFVFTPDQEEMWPEGNETFVDTIHLSNILQGAARPGHFRGVLSVVAKLFNITQADKAFFGEKDFQQLALIRRMVKDLSFPIEIMAVPVLREADGLAASSRNQLLSAEQRKAAVILSQALRRAQNAFLEGERDADSLKNLIKHIIQNEPLAQIESIDILDVDKLCPLTTIIDKAVILLSVNFGTIRLLDEKQLAPIISEENYE